MTCVFSVTCPLVDGMEDASTVPDSAIRLAPEGNPADIRPTGNGWKTLTLEERVATIEIGDDLKAGGIIQLVDPKNIREYIVELIKTPQVSS